MKDHNKLATWYFVEETVSFGMFDRFYVWLGLKDTGIFNRYRDYYVWSRWEKVLFLAPVPTADVRCRSKLLASNIIDEMIDEEERTEQSERASSYRSRITTNTTTKSWIGRKFRELLMKEEKKEFLNFDSSAELTPLRRFLKDLVGILLFGEMYKSLRAAIKTQNVFEIPFRIVDGFIEWGNYFIQISFPIVLIGFYYLVFACY